LLLFILVATDSLTSTRPGRTVKFCKVCAAAGNMAALWHPDYSIMLDAEDTPMLNQYPPAWLIDARRTGGSLSKAAELINTGQFRFASPGQAQCLVWSESRQRFFILYARGKLEDAMKVRQDIIRAREGFYAMLRQQEAAKMVRIEWSPDDSIMLEEADTAMLKAQPPDWLIPEHFTGGSLSKAVELLNSQQIKFGNPGQVVCLAWSSSRQRFFLMYAKGHQEVGQHVRQEIINSRAAFYTKPQAAAAPAPVWNADNSIMLDAEDTNMLRACPPEWLIDTRFTDGSTAKAVELLNSGQIKFNNPAQSVCCVFSASRQRFFLLYATGQMATAQQVQQSIIQARVSFQNAQQWSEEWKMTRTSPSLP